MRILLIFLLLFPFALLAQNSNYNALASGRVRLEGRSSFSPSFEIFVDSFTTLEQGSYSSSSPVFNTLTHYWPMSESAGNARTDVKGAISLAENSPGSVASVPGKHGNAADTSAGSSLKGTFSDSSTSTYSFWANVGTVDDTGTAIFNKVSGITSFNISVIDATLSGHLTAVQYHSFTGDISVDVTSLNIAPGDWFFVVLTFNGGTGAYSLSVNGGTFSSAGGAAFSPGSGLLDIEDNVNSFEVSIDELATYNTVLSQGDVATLWNSGSGTFYGAGTPDLMTLTYLTNSTISVGQFGWAYIPVSGGNTTFKRTYVGSNTFALPKATIAMGTAQYTTAGTRSASYDSNTNAVNEVAEFILPGGSGGNKTVVSFGMMIQFCATNSSATLITNRFVTLNGPPYGALQQEVSATIDEVRAYATDNGGVVAVGGAIPIVPCKLYWLTGVRNVTDGHANFSLYDPVNGAFIGESVAVMGTTNVTWNVQIGPQTAELATSGNTYWDNLIVNYHDGFYPLGPLKTTPPAPVQNVVQRRIFGQGGEEILGQGGETILGQ